MINDIPCQAYISGVLRGGSAGRGTRADEAGRVSDVAEAYQYEPVGSGGAG